MSEWQPIETAPKNGTWVLLGWPGSHVMLSARWLECEWVEEIEGEWVDEMFDPALNDQEEPTHWMRLPELPNE